MTGAAMPTLIGNEFRKLRTVRGPWLLLAAAQVVAVIGISGLLADGADPRLAATARDAVGHVGLVSLFTLVLGITAVAGEHRHRTSTDTYLSTPRRPRVVVAKLAAYTAAGAGFGAVTTVTALGATAGWLAAKGGSLDLADADLWRTVAGGVGWNAAFAAIGVGLGALVPSLTGALVVALGWIALVEGLAGQLLGDLSRWLPLASGRALDGLRPDPELLPQWGGGVVLAGYAAAFAVAAVATTVRRDVS